MKNAKRVFGFLLAVLLMASFPVSALAYSIADGAIEVFNDAGGQTVNGEPVSGTVEITGSSDKNPIFVFTSEGKTTNVALNGVTASGLFIDGFGKTNIDVQGSNTINNLPESALSTIIWDSEATFTGSGSLEMNGTYVGVEIINSNVTVDGPSITGKSELDGVVVLDSTLEVQNGKITGDGDGAAFYISPDSQLKLGDGVRVTDDYGHDLTAAALEDPSILAVPGVRVIEHYFGGYTVMPADGLKEAHLITMDKGVSFKKTGEPDAAAMNILSQGMKGECIYKATFEFTDQLSTHQRFQFNFALPKFGGKHVIIAQVVDGKQVTYDTWTCNNGLMVNKMNQLGDFAIYLA